MTDKIHIQGRVHSAPVKKSGKYVMYVTPNGKTDALKVIVNRRDSVENRYAVGDRIMVMGTRATVKNIADGVAQHSTVVRAETIILMPQREGT